MGDIFDEINRLPILDVLDTLWIGYRKKWANTFLVNQDWSLDESFAVSPTKNIAKDFGKTWIEWWPFDFIGRYCLGITEADMRTQEWRATTLQFCIEKWLIKAPDKKVEFKKSLTGEELLKDFDNFKLNGYKDEIASFLQLRGVSYNYIKSNLLFIGELFRDIWFYDNYFCTEFETWQDDDWKWQHKEGDKPKTTSVFMFPCYNQKKELIWIKLRRKDGKTIRGKKSIAVGKTGLYFDKINNQTSYILEGEMDYLIMRILGYDNLVANLGWVQSNKEMIRDLLAETAEIICLYDNDTAGRMVKSGLPEMMNRKVKEIEFPIREDKDGRPLTDINDFYKAGYNTKDKWDKIFKEAKAIGENQSIKQKYPFVFLRKYLEYYDTEYDRIQKTNDVSNYLGCTGKELFKLVTEKKIPSFHDLCYYAGWKDWYYNTLDESSIITDWWVEKAVLHEHIEHLISNIAGHKKKNIEWIHRAVLYKITHLNDVHLPALVLYWSGWCVDCNTEYLTPKWWKKIDNFTKWDLIWEYNQETGECEFREPLRYIKEEDNRLAYKIKWNRINMFLTWEHTIPYKSNRWHWHTTTMEDMYNKLSEKKSESYSSFNIISNFKLPDTECWSVDLTCDELRIMVAVIADGYILQENTKRVRIRIKKEEKKIRLRWLLYKTKYTETDELSNPWYTNFYFNAPRIDKVFTEYYWWCNKKQLEVIYNEFVYWDWYIDKRNWNKIFTTTKKESSDFIQYVISTCSNKLQSMSSSDRRWERRIYSNWKEYIRKSIDYIVRETSIESWSSVLYPHISREYLPNKTKYCFTTTTWNWIARRWNYIFITWNSWKWTFLNLLGEIFGHENTLVWLWQKDLESSFDSYQGQKLIVEFKEVSSGNTQNDKKILDRIKSFVGEPRITVNPKHSNVREVDNIAWFHLSSNHAVPIQMDSKHSWNRRFTIIKTGWELDHDLAKEMNNITFKNKKVIRQYVAWLYETYPDVPDLKHMPALDNEEKRMLEESCEGVGNQFFEWFEKKYPHIWKITNQEKNMLLSKYLDEIWEDQLDSRYKQKHFNLSLSHRYENKRMRIRWETVRGYLINKNEFDKAHIPDEATWEFEKNEVQRIDWVTF